MKVVVIGSTGHVGGFLVPRLVEAGHEVVAVSRGASEPYRPHAAWSQVTRLLLDRDAGDADGTFAPAIAALEADVVVDLICFTPDSARLMVDALRGSGTVLVHCGTIWVHGPSAEVPVTEEARRTPSGEYGTQKAEIERMLLAESRRPGGVRSVVLHPGHITGPGWPMINAVGNLDLSVWEALAAGREIAMPGLGLETVHHVHADDVAQAFQLAVERHAQAAGESFHVVSERAITLRGLAQAIARHYGQEARLRFVSWPEFREQTTAEFGDASWEHASRSHSMSIDKARRVLGYAPRYTTVQAVVEGLDWLEREGRLTIA
ncbi:NAD-dependent epimerase/dehydratase family protein [Frigoribacterium faeni]|uniref:Nucleoside-diphosphate-sugar epimerase n=1 Tax=Frigoribacterium faeni TaxID=145483 RepID=A0A7W3PJ48_9MICO|nr:NAD-dependent epimerase/dehydratase family protein [Frigoribacterium faeni]MBA8813389.1 nucleoside-diphosphate-sugar epimerase [Frigoribacterium faeni]GEK83094.1 UDP-glucose 4-epimerase [Frigoribacterium faeni]